MTDLANRKMFIILLIASIISPISFQSIPVLTYLYDILICMKICFFIYFLILYIKLLMSGHFKVDIFFILVILLMIMALISTIFNSGSIVGVINLIITSLLIVFTIKYYSAIKCEKFYVIFYWMYFIMTFFHLISVILFDMGISFGPIDAVNPLYFLSQDNGTALVVILFSFLTILICYLKNNKKYYLGMIIPVLLFLKIDSSSLKIVTIIIFGSIIFGKLLKNKYMYTIAIAMLSCFFIIVVSNSTGDNFLFRIIGSLMKRDYTMTGRTFLWEKGVDLFLEKPILGHGIPVYNHIEIWDGYFSPHNLYLDYLVSVGIFGGIVFFSIVSLTIIKSIQFDKSPIYKNVIYVFVSMLLYFMVESGIKNNAAYYFILLSVIYYLDAFKCRGGFINGCINNCAGI